EAARSDASDDDSGEDGKYRFYSDDRLLTFLQECRSLNPAALLEALREDVETFYAGNAPNDDFTLLVLRKLGND
ncbi:MAG: SpoIIE family protein phosphatase, partial [bacterium]